MKISINKVTHPKYPTIPHYEAHLHVPSEYREDEEETVVLASFARSHWGNGPHDGVRYEFPHDHPLSHFYPSTLREVKSLICRWIAAEIGANSGKRYDPRGQSGPKLP